MLEIAVMDAQDTLGAMLDRVEGGEEILLTRHGKPIARLVPTRVPIDRERMAAAMEVIRKQAAEAKIPFDWEELKRDRDEGRP